EISQAAVARVISDYLRFAGRSADTEGDHRRLKDRVNRALTGRALTPDTLQCFVRAFAMSDEDARQLWSSFSGSSPSQVNEVLEPAPHTSPKFETIALSETHSLGPDGQPLGHLTIQRIRALEDGASSYPVRFDNGIVAVKVANGSVSEIFR